MMYIYCMIDIIYCEMCDECDGWCFKKWIGFTTIYEWFMDIVNWSILIRNWKFLICTELWWLKYNLKKLFKSNTRLIIEITVDN